MPSIRDLRQGRLVVVKLDLVQSEEGQLQFFIQGLRGPSNVEDSFYETLSQPFHDQAYARIQGAMNSAIQMALNDLQRQFAAEKLKLKQK